MIPYKPGSVATYGSNTIMGNTIYIWIVLLSINEEQKI